jgi:hypothetical protein
MTIIGCGRIVSITVFPPNFAGLYLPVTPRRGDATHDSRTIQIR